MSKFINDHPFITLFAIGEICNCISRCVKYITGYCPETTESSPSIDISVPDMSFNNGEPEPEVADILS